ncbi:MAG: GNAT family N-acetyltransferase [Oceanospirillaceae bacterium]|nr:GNAT family N-acetyltransferase [Oceanospirillaceae bacterium]
MLIWQCKKFNELSINELYSIIKARQDVFIMEQDCVYADLDGADHECLHLFATLESDDLNTPHLNIVAYLRIVPPGVKYPQASLGRILTTSQARGTGAGTSLVTKALEQIERDHPAQDIKISAQVYLQKFYKSFGFKNISEIYDEDGIDHIDMLLTRT